MRGFGSTNVGGNWGPPPLDAGLLQYYNELAQQGMGTLAGMAGGAVGGGIAGMQNAKLATELAKEGKQLPEGTPQGFMAGAREGLFGGAPGGDEYRRLQDAGKSADSFYKAMGEEGQAQMGIHPEAWKTYGARDKAAAMLGFVKAQGAQEMMARLKDYAAQTEYRKQQATEDAAVGDAVRAYTEAPDVPTGEGDLMRPATADERMKSALQTPGLGGRGVPRMMEALQHYGMDGQAGKGAFFRPDQRTLDLPPQIANRFAQVVTGPNTSALVPVYGDNISALPILGPNGEQLGFGMPTGKGGGVTTIKDPAAMSPTAALEAYNDNQEKMIQLRQRLKMAKQDAEFGKIVDAPALELHLKNLEEQQPGLRAYFMPQSNGNGQNGQAKPSPQTVTTQGQFDKLPSGALYIGKDGTKYRKP